MSRNAAIRLAEATLKSTKEVGRSGTFISDGVIDGIEHNSKLTREEWLGQTGTAGIVQRMRLENPQLQALSLATKLPIIGAEWTIRPADYDSVDGLERLAAEEHAKIARRVVFESPMDDWRSTVRQGLIHLDFGFMLFEKVWEVADDGTYVIKRFAPRLPMTIQKWRTKEGVFRGVEQNFWDPDKQTFRTEELKAENLILITRDREGDNFGGVSLYRSTWAIHEIKKMLLKLLSIAHERESLGVPIAMRPEGGSSDDQDDKVEELLKNLRAHQKSFGMLPHGWSLEWYFNDGGTGAKAAIIEALRYLDEQILNAGLAQFIGLGSTATGSRAVAREHIDLFFLALNGIAADMATPFNGVGRSHTSGVIRQAVMLNAGEQTAYPWLEAQAIEAKNLEDFSTALQKMGSYITADDTVEEYVRSFLGVPATPEDQKQERKQKQDPTAPQNPPTDDPLPNKPEANADKELSDVVALRLSDLQDRPLTYAEQSVRFSEMVLRLDTAPADMVDDILDIARASLLKVNRRVQKAVQDRKPARLPKTIPGLEEALAQAVLDIVDRTREFGRQTVKDEQRRQSRTARLNLVRSQPRRFADPPDPDMVDALVTDYEAHLDIRDEALRAQAQEVAAEAASRVTSTMRVQAMGAIRRAENGFDLIANMPGAIQFKQPAAGLVATALNLGRDEAAWQLRGQVSEIQFSALMDVRTCPPCSHADGATFLQGSAEHMDHECPFGDCEGGGYCRCILVYVFKADQELPA